MSESTIIVSIVRTLEKALESKKLSLSSRGLLVQQIAAAEQALDAQEEEAKTHEKQIEECLDFLKQQDNLNDDVKALISSLEPVEDGDGE